MTPSGQTNCQGLIRDYYISIDVAADWSGKARVQIREHKGVAFNPPHCASIPAGDLLDGIVTNAEHADLVGDPITADEWGPAIVLATASNVHWPAGRPQP